ncbi:MAG: GGDEF domain-containing protein [Pseudomonadota bacterium]
MKISSRPPQKRKPVPRADPAHESVQMGTQAARPGAVNSTAADGDDDFLSIAGIPAAELTPRVQAALQTLMAEITSLRQSVAHLKDQVKAAEAQADQDPLLPVLNRRAFMRDLDRALAMARRYGTRAVLVFIDVDGLKSINDRHGHAAGDAALTHLVTTITDNIRSGDSFGRLGGDEFGLLLAETDAPLATTKMENLAARVRQTPIEVEAAMVPVRLSYGLCALSEAATDHTLTSEALLALADTRMYARKGLITR